MAIADRIAQLEKILATGASQVKVDGIATSYDLDAVRRELSRLRHEENPQRRPRCAKINLSSAWS